MIKPTNGRVVWFTPNTSDDIIKYGAAPLAAIIAHVWSDECVNLSVFDSNGEAHSRTSVRLIQDGGSPPGSQYCEWMPYQKGQAAKADMLAAEREGP